MEFIDKTKSEIPPYPHTVAYQNLIISCPAKDHCNNFRGNKDIKPVVLYRTINEEIKYNPDGSVEWEKETEDIPTIVNLGLNKNPLKMIRRIWLYATENNKNIDTQRDEIIDELMPESTKEDEDCLAKLKKNDTEWKKLKQYDYFKIRQIARQLNNMSANEIRELLEILSQKLS